MDNFTKRKVPSVISWCTSTKTMYKEQQPVLRGREAVVAQETGVRFGAWG